MRTLFLSHILKNCNFGSILVANPHMQRVAEVILFVNSVTQAREH